MQQKPSTNVPHQQPQVTVTMQLFTAVLTSQKFSTHRQELIRTPQRRGQRMSNVKFPARPRRVISHTKGRQHIPTSKVTPRFCAERRPTKGHKPTVTIHNSHQRRLQTTYQHIHDHANLHQHNRILHITKHILHPIILQRVRLTYLHRLFHNQVNVQLYTIARPKRHRIHTQQRRIITRSSKLPTLTMSKYTQQPRAITQPSRQRAQRFQRAMHHSPEVKQDTATRTMPCNSSRRTKGPQ